MEFVLGKFNGFVGELNIDAEDDWGCNCKWECLSIGNNLLGVEFISFNNRSTDSLLKIKSFNNLLVLLFCFVFILSFLGRNG